MNTSVEHTKHQECPSKLAQERWCSCERNTWIPLYSFFNIYFIVMCMLETLTKYLWIGSTPRVTVEYCFNTLLLLLDISCLCIHLYIIKHVQMISKKEIWQWKSGFIKHTFGASTYTFSTIQLIEIHKYTKLYVQECSARSYGTTIFTTWSPGSHFHTLRHHANKNKECLETGNQGIIRKKISFKVDSLNVFFKL